MALKVLDYTIISKIADLSMKLSRIKKDLWKVNRKSYNLLKSEIKQVDEVRETTKYYVMQATEMSVDKGLKVIEELKELFSKFSQILQKTYNAKSIHYIKELNGLLDEADALRVLIRLSDHDDSFFSA